MPLTAKSEETNTDFWVDIYSFLSVGTLLKWIPLASPSISATAPIFYFNSILIHHPVDYKRRFCHSEVKLQSQLMSVLKHKFLCLVFRRHAYLPPYHSAYISWTIPFTFCPDFYFSGFTSMILSAWNMVWNHYCHPSAFYKTETLLVWAVILHSHFPQS